MFVWSHDPEELEKTLPQLLLALDIPQDALGIIVPDPQYSVGAWVPDLELVPAGALIEAGSEVAESPASATSMLIGAVYSVAGAATLVVPALVLLASLRLLRKL